MIDKAYFNNVSSRNILTDYKPKDFSNTEYSSFVDTSLENMIINSNLENQSIIK